MSGIGRLFSAHQVEEAAIAALRKRLPLYLLEAKEQFGLQLPEIQSWGLANETYERPAEAALPALVVISEAIGRGGEPETYSGGWYRAGWALGVVVAVQHPDENMARKISQIYAAVVRGAILQERSLGIEGCEVDWLDEGYPYESANNCTRAAAENIFLVKQDEVVNWQQGPTGDELPDTPPPDGPEVTEIEVNPEAKK